MYLILNLYVTNLDFARVLIDSIIIIIEQY